MADGTHEQFHCDGMSGRISMPYEAMPETSGLGMATLQLWRAIRRHRRLFFGLCIAVWLLGGTVLAVLRPVYTATATVALATQNIDPLAPVGQQQADQFQDDDLPQTIAAAMQSRDVAAAVLADIPPAAAIGPGIAQQSPVDDFLRHLTVTPEAHSRIIDVDFSAKAAPLAQALANAVVTNYQKISLAQQTAQSDHVADWLDARTQNLQARWLAAVQAADNYRSANHITEASDGAATGPLIDQQISDTATRLAAAQSQLIDAQALHGSGHGVATTTAEPAASATANMLAQLETARAQLAGEFGPNYPKLATLDAQISALRLAPASYAAAPSVAPSSGLAVAKAQVARLTAQLDQLTQAQVADGLTQANYLTLKAEADNAHTAYSTFVEHAAEVADRASLLQPAITLISPAGLPLRPSFPDRPKLGLGVVLLGLIAGAGACLIKDQSGQRFATPRTDSATVPLLSAIPFVPAQPGRIIARHVIDDPYSRTSEALRGVANALSLLAIRPGSGRCILVSSAAAREGRSTVAAWLASTVRQTGERVLLITSDPPPAARADHAMPMKLGLTDVFFGSATAEQVIENDPVTGLDMISAGSIKGQKLEPLDMMRVRSTLENLQSTYRLVVIDSPSLASSTDGLMLSAVAETVFVCRWQHSAPRAVTAAIDRLQAAGATVSRIIVTMVEKDSNPALESEVSGRELTLITRLYGA